MSSSKSTIYSHANQILAGSNAGHTAQASEKQVKQERVKASQTSMWLLLPSSDPATTRLCRIADASLLVALGGPLLATVHRAVPLLDCLPLFGRA